MGKANIFTHGHPFNEAQILVDKSDLLLLIGLGRAVRIGFFLEQDAAFIGCVNARKRFDQCGFASAIFAEQGKDFTCRQIKGNVAQSGGAAEALGDVFKCDESLLHRHTPVQPEVFP